MIRVVIKTEIPRHAGSDNHLGIKSPCVICVFIWWLVILGVSKGISKRLVTGK